MSDQPDMINHPPHYTSCPSGIECIEIAELLPFCLGNAYKYLHRAGLKGDMLTDLKKARFYIHRAWLNNESISTRAKNRIFHVARHRTDIIKTLMLDFQHFNDGGGMDKRIIATLDKTINEFDNNQSHLDDRST